MLSVFLEPYRVLLLVQHTACMIREQWPKRGPWSMVLNAKLPTPLETKLAVVATHHCQTLSSSRKHEDCLKEPILSRRLSSSKQHSPFNQTMSSNQEEIAIISSRTEQEMFLSLLKTVLLNIYQEGASKVNIEDLHLDNDQLEHNQDVDDANEEGTSQLSNSINNDMKSELKESLRNELSHIMAVDSETIDTWTRSIANELAGASSLLTWDEAANLSVQLIGSKLSIMFPSTNETDSPSHNKPPMATTLSSKTGRNLKSLSETERQQAQLKENITYEMIRVALGRIPRKNPEKRFTCEFCTKVFSRLFNLQTHLKSHHGGLKPFPCSECHQSFSRKHDLKRHTKTHSKERPFPCEKCGTSFARKDALKRHQRIKCQKTMNKNTDQPSSPALHSSSNKTVDLQTQLQELSNTIDDATHAAAAEILASLGVEGATSASKNVDSLEGISHEDALKAVEALAAVVAVAKKTTATSMT